MSISSAESQTTGWSDPEPRWSLDPLVRHMNHGSFGAVPVAVQAEQARLRGLMEWNPVRWFATLAPRIASAREEMASLLNVDSSRMAFVLNASAGASVVFQSLLGAEPVDVLVTDHGYGAITMGADRLAQRTGGQTRTVGIPLSSSADEALSIVVAALDQYRPKLLVVDQVTSATARQFPVDDMCRAARERNVLTLVDGAHAPGVLADPVCREADYWVGNLHKFVCAPRGAALLVSRDTGQELFPVIDSWGSPMPFPERFDHNGTLDITAWLTAPFAWRHLEETIGWSQVRDHARTVMNQGCALVAEALSDFVEDPQPDVGQPVGPLRLLRLPGTLASTHPAADALRVPFGDATGIAAAFTNFDGKGYIRLSAHAYTSIHDFAHLAKVGIPLLHAWSSTQTMESASSQQPTIIKEDRCATNF
ncbi:aminotransferase class V-fold PLP-dependent enzyme [Tessaracoccus sp.]